MLLTEKHPTQFIIRKYLLFVLYICLHHIKTSNSQFQFSTPDRTDELVPCHIPTGRASFCVPLKRCKQVSALVTNLQKPIPGDVGKYIKESFFCQSKDKSVCCPFNSIINPKPEKRPIIRNREEECSVQDVQGGKTGTCTLYFQCPPLLQLLSNLKRPFPPEVPRLLQNSILCGRENVGGINLPKVCCPTEALKLPDIESFQNHPNRGVLASTCPIERVASSRIVGGVEAPIGEYPWLALLGYSPRGGGKPQWKCGGALIGEQYILTAAHCVTDLPGSFALSKIRLGEHTISNDGPDCSPTDKSDCNLGTQDFDIEKVIVHPSYNAPEVFQNDIALVKLKGKIDANNFVKPICLPFDDNAKEDYRKHQNGTDIVTHVAGWGATDPRGARTADSLQTLNITIFDGAECRSIYKKRGGKLSDQSQICAGGEAGRDSCVGDSGSALMTTQKEDGKLFYSWKLLGIVSFGPRICGTNNVPGVYSKVRHYINWILDNVGP